MSEIIVNLHSIDAMFATILAEQKATRTAIDLRLDKQDQELVLIREQTTKTNGRVTGLEQRERDFKVRIGTVVACATALGGTLSFFAHKLFPAFLALSIVFP